jgi:DNA-binding NtrC family response regulator
MDLNQNNTKSILLVDDDPEMLELFTESLEALSFKVHTAANGLLALEFLSNNKVDCIVTDISMPGLSGTQFIHQLQEHLDFTPFFFITGYQDYPREKLNIYKPIAIIFKPFDFEEASVLISNYLNKNI